MFYILYPFVTYLLTLPRILSDITPCSVVKVNRRFGGTTRLHLQGRRLSTEQASL
jgi:hypothetical protein